MIFNVNKKRHFAKNFTAQCKLALLIITIMCAHDSSERPRPKVQTMEGLNWNISNSSDFKDLKHTQKHFYSASSGKNEVRLRESGRDERDTNDFLG